MKLVNRKSKVKIRDTNIVLLYLKPAAFKIDVNYFRICIKKVDFKHMNALIPCHISVLSYTIHKQFWTF